MMNKDTATMIVVGLGVVAFIALSCVAFDRAKDRSEQATMVSRQVIGMTEVLNAQGQSIGMLSYQVGALSVIVDAAYSKATEALTYATTVQTPTASRDYTPTILVEYKDNDYCVISHNETSAQVVCRK